MARIFRHYVSPSKLTLAITDFFLIFVATISAEAFRYYLADLDFVITGSPWTWMVRAVIPAVALPALIGVGAYQADAIRDFRVFAARCVVGLALTALILSALAFLLPRLPFWRSILLLALTSMFIVLTMSHGLFARFGKTSLLKRRVMILGAGKNAAEVVKFIERTPEAGLMVVGVVPLPGEGAVVEAAETGVAFESFSLLVAARRVELMIVANEGELAPAPTEALIACKFSGLDVQDSASFFEQMRGFVKLETVRADWIIFSDGFKGGLWFEKLLKRGLDIVVSLIVLVLTMPLLLLTAVAIKMTSPGPVFYLQDRVGLNGGVFRLAKFRSMRVDAEKIGEPQWAQEKDPRVTAVGRVIRRTRIDELPQLFNVLKGDMSFVGPRPERPYFVAQLEKEILFYRERHWLKPGITGWAQIHYPYGASIEDARHKLEYDLYYIKNYSLFLDLLIILQTVRVIIFPIGVR